MTPTAGLLGGARTFIRRLDAEPEAQRLQDENDGLKPGRTLAAQALIKALARQTCVFCDLAHTAHLGDHADRADECINVVGGYRFVEIGDDVLVTLEVLGS